MEGRSFREIKEQVCVLIMRVITSSYACAKIPRTAHKKAGSPFYCYHVGFPGGLTVENLPSMQQTQVIWDWSLGQEDPLEEVTVTHYSILTWRILWTKEPDGLQSMGSQRLNRLSIHICNVKNKNV